MERQLKILVVDDDEVDRMAVSRSLKKAGLNIELLEAEDSASAISNLKNHNFDCVFLDYRLPDEDGLNLVKNIKELGVKVPLIVLTGQGDEQIAVELMKAGAADYLSKSRISPETLYQILRNAIRVYRAEMEVELANQRLRATNEILRNQNQELEKQRQQIQLQNIELVKLDKLKSQFLANISHELRTPMNAIMGFSQLLLGQYLDPLTEKQRDLVQRILNNSQHLLTMLNEVLDFSKVESGKMNLKIEEFDLAKLVKITIEELRSLAIEKNISLKLDVHLANKIIINDREALRRVLVNLISNGIKFTEKGEVLVEVRETSNEKVAIAVSDTGIGIPQEHLSTIFEAFRQVNQSLNKKYYGTGLGLAIVNSMVKMMQGKITVQSEVGQGSVFQVEIDRKIQINL